MFLRSGIAGFVATSQKLSLHDRISDTGTFLDYQAFCKDIVKQPQFGNLQRDIEQKVGYDMSPLRVAELVMYAKGGKD